MNSRTLRASGAQGAEAQEIPQNTYPWSAFGTVCDFLEGKWGVTVAPRGSGGGIAGTPWRGTGNPAKHVPLEHPWNGV